MQAGVSVVDVQLQCTRLKTPNTPLIGCVAQLAERRSLAGELTLFYALPVADG